MRFLLHRLQRLMGNKIQFINATSYLWYPQRCVLASVPPITCVNLLCASLIGAGGQRPQWEPFLALVAAVLRVYHRAGWTEGSPVIKWNADHLSAISHNPTAYLTSLPSGVLNSGCIDDKRNTDNNPKFHHRSQRPWLRRRLHHSRKPSEITVTYRFRRSYFLRWFGEKNLQDAFQKMTIMT